MLTMQIGMSDKSVLRDFHPDAEDLYNVTMDLSTVCKELKDCNKRMPRRVHPCTMTCSPFTKSWHCLACATQYALLFGMLTEEEEQEEDFYKLLPANKADHLCHRMARTTGVFCRP